MARCTPARGSAISEHPALETEPRRSDYRDQPKRGCRKENASEELPFETVLDRVKDHERENEPDQEQQQRPERWMPQAPLERLAQPNHGSMVDEHMLGGGRRGSK